MPRITQTATYTPMYFYKGKAVRGEPQETSEAAWEVIEGWKKHHGLTHPVVVEVKTTRLEGEPNPTQPKPE